MYMARSLQKAWLLLAALSSVQFLYQPAVLYCFLQHTDLRLGLKALLECA